ncbi:MAG: ROK family protein [Candidatus Coatesbacteria bacterium]|nr:MAG: ROK family protein [Candidatus Coatesbacteria bacterium]
MKKLNTIGIDIGGSKTAALFVGADGEILAENSFPTDSEGGYEGFLKRLTSVIIEGIVGGPSPAGIGVAAAAQVSRTDGKIIDAPNLLFSNVPICADIEKAVGAQACLENDVNAAAFGEYSARKDPREPFLAIFVGTGVGAGIIIEGRIFHGSSGYAGEIGHVPVEPLGAVCGCGARGCLEAYAGGAGIGRRAAAAVRYGRAPLLAGMVSGDELPSADKVAAAASEGCSVSAGILTDAAKALGVALVSAVNLFAPGTLVLGGGVVDAYPRLAELAADYVKNGALPLAVADLVVERSLLGARAAALGAARLAASDKSA